MIKTPEFPGLLQKGWVTTSSWCCQLLTIYSQALAIAAAVRDDYDYLYVYAYAGLRSTIACYFLYSGVETHYVVA